MKRIGIIAFVLFAAMAFGLSARTLYLVREPPAGTLPVYRFWSPIGQCHFYTISEREKDKLIDLYADRWTFEGVAFFAWPADGNAVAVQGGTRHVSFAGP